MVQYYLNVPTYMEIALVALHFKEFEILKYIIYKHRILTAEKSYPYMPTGDSWCMQDQWGFCDNSNLEKNNVFKLYNKQYKKSQEY